MIPQMLRNVFHFERAWSTVHGYSLASRAVIGFIQFLEKRLGFEAMYDAERIAFGRPELLDIFELAETLKRSGIIRSFSPATPIPDEPPIRMWRAVSAMPGGDLTGAMDAKSDRKALMPTLAEALERHIWQWETDYFKDPRTCTFAEISSSGRAINPERFAGFSEAQRVSIPEVHLSAQDEYLWIRARSLTGKDSVFVPAQIVSPKGRAHAYDDAKREPILRLAITTGLATWSEQEGALLGGALEVIERDAFMIMWLNQLSLPRLDVETLAKENSTLGDLVERCGRYRLRVHLIHLLTDAPAHVVCAVVEDTTTHIPRFTLGLKAHRNLSHAAEGSLLEALRMRVSARIRMSSPPKDWRPDKKASEIIHMDRLLYWVQKDRHRDLEFLIAGTIESSSPDVPWETGAPSQHLQYIVEWCAQKGYECASVPLTKSAKNPLPWHIEMVVIPELQPLHQNERYPYLGGERIAIVPRQFGYTPRSKPFSKHPQPFC